VCYVTPTALPSLEEAHLSAIVAMTIQILIIKIILVVLIVTVTVIRTDGSELLMRILFSL
jgi:hypothetical protein